MTDGYKYIDVFYHLQTPEFKVEVNITSLVGNAKFSTLFYSDEQHTQYLGESANQDIVVGPNLFQVGSLQYGNMSLYVIGRIKVLQGSTLVIDTLKINDLVHMSSGNLMVNTPPLSFVESVVDDQVYYSLTLGLIQDPTFQIEYTVQKLIGVLEIEYVYYNNDTYRNIHSIQSLKPTNDTTSLQVSQVNKYVVFRFQLLNKSYLKLASFMIQQLEQGEFTFKTPFFLDDTIVVSETCFPAHTQIKTDQGTLSIQKLVPHHHTIQGKSVVALTATYSSDKEMVLLQKDSIRKNYPAKDTLMSRKHKIYMKGKLKAAYRLVDQYKGISLVPYQGQKLYNVVLEDYGLMNVQGMLCETLHPLNPMAQYFRQLYPNKIESPESFLLQ
jgi:hypothetical protein